MFLTSNTFQTITCRVSPESEHYGKRYPIYVFYNDGSWSRQQGAEYFRSVPDALIKPHCELTVNDILHILDNSVVNHIKRVG